MGDGTCWVVGDGMQVANCHAMRYERNEANAHLISAAPDMYEALEALLSESMAISKRVCDEYCVPYEPSTHEEGAINAIKKARGG